MSDLVRTIHEFAEMFDRLRIPYAIMGGWAVRLYGLPRPTYDIDFTITADRSRLAEPLGVAEKLEEVLASRP